jgi:hypothetical protein
MTSPEMLLFILLPLCEVARSIRSAFHSFSFYASHGPCYHPTHPFTTRASRLQMKIYKGLRTLLRVLVLHEDSFSCQLNATEGGNAFITMVLYACNSACYFRYCRLCAFFSRVLPAAQALICILSARSKRRAEKLQPAWQALSIAVAHGRRRLSNRIKY